MNKGNAKRFGSILNKSPVIVLHALIFTNNLDCGFEFLEIFSFNDTLSRNVTVDIFVTAMAASEYNFYYRQIQAKEFAKEAKR